MSSSYHVTVDDNKTEVIYHFLDALHWFTQAVRDGAESVTLKWSA